jgi:hypothetical protein
MGGHHDLSDQNPASPGTSMAASLNRDIVIPPFTRFNVLVPGSFSGRGASRGRVAGTCFSGRCSSRCQPFGRPRTVRTSMLSSIDCRVSSIAAPKNSETVVRFGTVLGQWDGYWLQLALES